MGTSKFSAKFDSVYCMQHAVLVQDIIPHYREMNMVSEGTTTCYWHLKCVCVWQGGQFPGTEPLICGISRRIVSELSHIVGHPAGVPGLFDGGGETPHIWCQRCCEHGSHMRIKEKHTNEKAGRKLTFPNSLGLHQSIYKELEVCNCPRQERAKHWHAQKHCSH